MFERVEYPEAAHVHRHVLGTYPSQKAHYSEDVAERVERGSTMTLAEYLDGVRMMHELRLRFAAIFESVDVLMLPLAPGPPPLIETPDIIETGEGSANFRNLLIGLTGVMNLIGIPVMTARRGRDPNGLPVSIQVATNHWGEELAAKIAALFDVRDDVKADGLEQVKSKQDLSERA